MIQRAISIYTVMNHFCPVTRILNSFETAMIIYLFLGGEEVWKSGKGVPFTWRLHRCYLSILQYFMLTEREIFRSVLGINKGWILIAIDSSNKSLLLTSLAACILPPVLAPSVSFSNKEFSYFHWRYFKGLPLKCVHWFCYQGDLKTRPTHL